MFITFNLAGGNSVDMLTHTLDVGSNKVGKNIQWKYQLFLSSWIIKLKWYSKSYSTNATGVETTAV